MREEVGGEAAHGPAPLLQAWVRVRPAWASREGERQGHTHREGGATGGPGDPATGLEPSADRNLDPVTHK